MAVSLIYISFHKLKGNQKTHLSRHLDIQLCNLACHFFAIVAELLARAKRVTRFNPLWVSARGYKGDREGIPHVHPIP